MKILAKYDSKFVVISIWYNYKGKQISAHKQPKLPLIRIFILQDRIAMSGLCN